MSLSGGDTRLLADDPRTDHVYSMDIGGYGVCIRECDVEKPGQMQMQEQCCWKQLRMEEKVMAARRSQIGTTARAG